MEVLGCVPALKALGDETRLKILQLLLNRQLSAGDIATEVGATQYNVSRHLKVLRDAGLIECEKQGQFRLYRVPPSLRRRVLKSGSELDLGCCTFRLDKAVSR